MPQASDLFTPVRRRTFEDVVVQIREQIARGGLQEGDKLPPERQLADALGVSRNTVREALRALEYAGLLTLRPGSGGGAFVSNGGANTIRIALNDLLQLGSLSTVDLIEARMVLGREVARLACLRCTQEDLLALEQNVEALRAATKDSKLRVTLSVEFHRLLAKATGNPVLIIMTNVLVDITMSFVRVVGEMPNNFVLESRLRTLKNLRSGDVAGVVREYEAYMEMTLSSYLGDRRLNMKEIQQPLSS